MAGAVAVSLRRTATRIPLSLPVRKRDGGDPAFRQAGWGRLTYREKVVADLVLTMYQSIPVSVLADYANKADDGALGLAIGLSLQPYQKLFEEELAEQFLDSGVHAAREWRKEISRGWARLGKAEVEVPPSPSRAALNFEFDRASPTATKWAKTESAKLINDLVDSQAAAVRAVVAQAYVDGRTYGTTATAIAKILTEVNPTGDIGKMLAEQYAVNTGGLFPRYGKAVANYAAAQAESLTKQGITGTKALETITKRSQRYADKLRRSRAKMIARTEIMRANNEGKLEAAYQAANKGLVDPKTAQRQWMTAPMDVCQVCAPLHGVTVGLYESWYLGDPPAHPNCRCTFRLITNPQLYGVPAGTGSGTALSPARFTFPKLPKLDDDFLPGAPVIEPLPPVGTQPAGPLPETLPPDPMPGSAPEGPSWWSSTEEAKWGKWDDLAPEHQVSILDYPGGHPGGLDGAIDDILGVAPADIEPAWFKTLGFDKGGDVKWADLAEDAQEKLRALTNQEGMLDLDDFEGAAALINDALGAAPVADDILTGSGGWFQPGQQQETLSNLDNIISPKLHHKNTPMAVRVSDAIESVGGSPGEAKVWHDLTLPPGVKGLNPYDPKAASLVYVEGKSAGYLGLKKELKKLVDKGQLNQDNMDFMLLRWEQIDDQIFLILDKAAKGHTIVDDDWVQVFTLIHKLNQLLADELLFAANKGALLEETFTKGSKWRLFIDDQIQTAKIWADDADTFTSPMVTGMDPPVFPPKIKPLSDAFTSPSSAGGITPAGAPLKKPSWWNSNKYGKWDDIDPLTQQELKESVVDAFDAGVIAYDEAEESISSILNLVDDADDLSVAGPPPGWWDEDAIFVLWDDLEWSVQEDLLKLDEMLNAGAIDIDDVLQEAQEIVYDASGLDVLEDVALVKIPDEPDWFEPSEWGKWDDLTADQQHTATEAVAEYWQDAPSGAGPPGFGDVEDIVNDILIPPEAIVDELIEDAIATFGPDGGVAEVVDQGLQSVLHHVVVSTGDDAFQFIDDMIDTVPATPGTKNAPKKLKIKRRLDELADMVGEEPLTGVHGYLDEIVLPPGMKNVNDKGFVDARWRLRKDFVKKGYLTQEEGDALADALDAIRKQLIVGNLDDIVTGEMLMDVADEFIKLNQTLASRVKANTLANGTKPPGGSLLKKFMETQEAFSDNYGPKLLDLAEDAKTAWDDLLPTNGQFVNDLGNPIPPHLLSEAGAPSAAGIPKPKKPPKGYTIPEAKPLPGVKRISQPSELPFTPGRLIEDKALGKKLSGQHPKQVYRDPDTGRMWIFKPQPKWQSELDRATSELQRRLGLQGAETHVVKLNGKVGSIQEVLGGSFDDTVSIFAGKVFDPTKLSTAQATRMQQNQLLDFLFSNYDSHSENFLRLRQATDADMLPIGIDKGQAFKHFGKKGESDGLVNWLYNPNNNAPAKNPYGVMLEKFAAGEKVAYQWADKSEDIQQFIASAKELAESGELEKVLKPYIDEAAAAGRLPTGYDADRMMAEIYDRFKNLGDEVKRLDEKLLKTQGGAIRTAEEAAQAAADAAALALEARVAELGMAAPSAFRQTTSQWANKVLKPVTMALSDPVRKAVRRYTGSYYGTVNNALRGKSGKGGKTKIAEVLSATDRKNIKLIDEAMTPLKDDIIVHRGTHSISDTTGKVLDAKNLEGTILGDFGFQSTSVGDTAAFGGQYKLKIYVQKGVKAVYANPISNHKGERELLLQRGLRLYVRKVTKVGSQYEIECVAIPDSVVIPGVADAMKVPIYKQLEAMWRSLVMT